MPTFCYSEDMREKRIDDYLHSIAAPERRELEKIRDTIHELLPDATEVISYGMPGFKYKGKYLAGFNAFKDHLSFFPTSSPVERYKDNLADFKLSKGTIQFTPAKPIPEALIKKLVATRAADIDSGSKVGI